ncbi:MAG: hypothetical protein KZQ61_17330 [Candidatus Thiodiazotropha sp. (ex Lucinoma aequizonata)]|nr:hypothetical protein [Candidatus Thiodiazotropha sp. (ex Lucinoma aequizonata)]
MMNKAGHSQIEIAQLLYRSDVVKEFCTPQLSCFFPFQQLLLIVILAHIPQI